MDWNRGSESQQVALFMSRIFPLFLCSQIVKTRKQASHNHPMAFKFCWRRWKLLQLGFVNFRWKSKASGNVKKRKFFHRWNSILISIFLFTIIAVDGNERYYFYFRLKSLGKISSTEWLNWLITLRNLIWFSSDGLKLLNCHWAFIIDCFKKWKTFFSSTENLLNFHQQRFTWRLLLS